MLLLTLLLLTASSHAADSLKKVSACKTTASVKTVYFVKQWHLNAGDNTKTQPDLKKYPQAQNQQEIYQMLFEWIAAKKIDTVIAEGCEGEMNASFKPAFNGWTYADLNKISKKPEYSSIATHVGLKAEARFGDQVRTICADDAAKIKEGLVALSDMRGDLGYWMRLKQHVADPARAKPYLDGVVEMFKLKPTTTVAEAIEVVRTDLKKAFVTFTASLQARNQKVIEQVKAEKSNKPIVVVYGGLHIDQLKELAEKENLNCEVFEPLHYDNQESKLMEDFKAAIN